MKKVVCYSKKYGNQTAFIDNSDYKTINKHRWNFCRVKLKNKDNDEIKYKYYAKTTVRIDSKSYIISMHHMIFGKPKKGFVIDHINGNSLDNTRINLREITRQHNSQNRKSKNKYLGVNWNKNAKKYVCTALHEHIGYFDDEKSAALEYDKYIIRILGYEDSRLNYTYTQEEVENIKSEICQVVTKKQEKENRELPSHINLTKNNTYLVQFQTGIFKVNKTFKTLKEAINFKEECLKEIEKIEEENKQQYYSQPIIRNKDKIAFIYIKYDDKEYECLVDDDKWHDLTYNIKWHYSDGYAQTNLNKTVKQLQRFLYEKYLPEKDISNLKIDHINRNRLDNRMSNLRPVTDGINMYNKETTNKYGYRGVVQIRKKYRAKINYNNERYQTKGFKTIEEAALAYNELAIKYYGKDIALLNIVS